MYALRLSLDRVLTCPLLFSDGAHHISSCASLLARLVLGFSGLDELELLQEASEVLIRLIKVLTDALRLHTWDLASLALTRCRVILPALRARVPEFAAMEAARGKNAASRRSRVPVAPATEEGPREPKVETSDVTAAAAAAAAAGAAGGSITTPSSEMAGSLTQGTPSMLGDHSHNNPLDDIDWRALGLNDSMEGWMMLDVDLGVGDASLLSMPTQQ